MVIWIIIIIEIFSLGFFILEVTLDDKNAFDKPTNSLLRRCASVLQVLLMIFSLPVLIILLPYALIREFYEKKIKYRTKRYKRKEAERARKIAEDEKRKALEYEKWIREHPNKFRDQPNGDLEKDLISYLYLSSDLPFKPENKQIIYFEDKHYDLFNKYFRENEKEIQTFFYRNGGYDFIFIPTILEDAKKIEEINRYHHPSGELSEIDHNNLSSNFLMKYFVDLCSDDDKIRKENGHDVHCDGDEIPGVLGPALICFGHGFGIRLRWFSKRYGYNHNVYCFAYFRLLPPEQKPLEQQIHNIFCDIHSDQNVFYSLVRNEDYSEADSTFNADDAELIDEIKEKVEKLRLHGITEGVIESLFKKKEKLSRLIVTSDHRIILPDYKDMEIKMDALPKAVFLLFLNHPEGIIFKCLPDYRDELSGIYNHLTNRSNDKDLKQSIDDVTDPTKNSINEKCARIRGAFISHFADSLADNYCITGKRGEAKKIILPRNLVKIESGNK